MNLRGDWLGLKVNDHIILFLGTVGQRGGRPGAGLRDSSSETRSIVTRLFDNYDDDAESPMAQE